MKGIFSSENITAVIIMIAFLIAAFTILVIAVQPTMNRIEWAEETYIVKSGDSLWTIADNYCPDIVDKREWIEEVKHLNKINDSTIHPGQRLTILVPKA